MVIWTGGLKEVVSNRFFQEIADVVRVCAGLPLKVIIETSLLKREQKILACQLSHDAGAQFVKTSSGFSDAGATTRRYFTDAPDSWSATWV